LLRISQVSYLHPSPSGTRTGAYDYRLGLRLGSASRRRRRAAAVPRTPWAPSVTARLGLGRMGPARPGGPGPPTRACHDPCHVATAVPWRMVGSVYCVHCLGRWPAMQRLRLSMAQCSCDRMAHRFRLGRADPGPAGRTPRSVSASRLGVSSAAPNYQLVRTNSGTPPNRSQSNNGACRDHTVLSAPTSHVRVELRPCPLRDSGPPRPRSRVGHGPGHGWRTRSVPRPGGARASCGPTRRVGAEWPVA
jgi:hypothetical protein